MLEGEINAIKWVGYKFGPPGLASEAYTLEKA